MRILILIATAVLVGCSTAAHVEGTGDVGTTLRAIESIKCRLDVSYCNHNVGFAPYINRTIGEINSLQDQPLKFESLPYILQQIGTL